MDPFDFTPVPLRARRDGWTAARQRAFVEALRACRCVVEACRRVGMSPKSAYRLYGRPDAASFRRAWQAALAEGPRLAAPAPPPPVVAPWGLTGMMIALAGKEGAPPPAPHPPAHAKPRASTPAPLFAPDRPSPPQPRASAPAPASARGPARPAYSLDAVVRAALPAKRSRSAVSASLPSEAPAAADGKCRLRKLHDLPPAGPDLPPARDPAGGEA